MLIFLSHTLRCYTNTQHLIPFNPISLQPGVGKFAEKCYAHIFNNSAYSVLITLIATSQTALIKNMHNHSHRLNFSTFCQSTGTKLFILLGCYVTDQWKIESSSQVDKKLWVSNFFNNFFTKIPPQPLVKIWKLLSIQLSSQTGWETVCCGCVKIPMKCSEVCGCILT